MMQQMMGAFMQWFMQQRLQTPQPQPQSQSQLQPQPASRQSPHAPAPAVAGTVVSSPLQRRPAADSTAADQPPIELVGFSRQDGFIVPVELVRRLFDESALLDEYLCKTDDDKYNAETSVTPIIEMAIGVAHGMWSAEPKLRNYMLNSLNSNQVFVFEDTGCWESIMTIEAIGVLFDAVYRQIYRILTTDMIEGLTGEQQNALGMLCSLYRFNAFKIQMGARNRFLAHMSSRATTLRRLPAAMPAPHEHYEPLARPPPPAHTVQAHPLYMRPPQILRAPHGNEPDLSFEAVMHALLRGAGRWTAQALYGNLYEALVGDSSDPPHDALQRQERLDQINTRLGEVLAEDPPSLSGEVLDRLREAKEAYETSAP